MDIRIEPTRLIGTVTPPPSKSQAHRLLLCAALAEGESTISNVALSQDITATLRCLEALGAKVRMDGSTAVVRGIGGHNRVFETLPTFDCGESGSTLRFLIPIALAIAGGGVFTGQGRLMDRPQQPYFDLFADKGIAYTLDYGILTMEGRLAPGEYALAGNVSSQFFSGLLFALPLLAGDSTVVSTTPMESIGYINMTRQAQEACGVTSDCSFIGDQPGKLPAQYAIPGSQCYRAVNSAVEADWSQAAFWYAARGVGNQVEIAGMNPKSLQYDRVIADQGWQFDGPPASRSIPLTHCPDLAPPLAVWAALRPGHTRLEDAARLRIKESDRLSAIAEVLTALGTEVTEEADSLTIVGKEALPGGVTVDAHNDHRIAMMTAIAATCCEKPVVLRGAECVAKSYPDFWEVYQSLGGVIHVL